MSDLDWKWNDYFRGTGFAGPTVRRILQEPLLPELGGVLPPSISPLIVSYFISIWQLYLIMMAVELNKYWRNYIAEFYQWFLKLFNSKELLGNPKQFKKYVNCTYKVFWAIWQSAMLSHRLIIFQTITLSSLIGSHVSAPLTGVVWGNWPHPQNDLWRVCGDSAPTAVEVRETAWIEDAEISWNSGSSQETGEV